MTKRNRLPPELAREFLRVCKQVDPTGIYTDIYRTHPLLNELWKEAVEAAKPQLKIVKDANNP